MLRTIGSLVLERNAGFTKGRSTTTEQGTVGNYLVNVSSYGVVIMKLAMKISDEEVEDPVFDWR